jgi:hypothetical protein
MGRDRVCRDDEGCLSFRNKGQNMIVKVYPRRFRVRSGVLWGITGSAMNQCDENHFYHSNRNFGEQDMGPFWGTFGRRSPRSPAGFSPIRRNG